MIKGIIFDCFGVLCHGSLDYLRSMTPPEHLREFNDLSHASDYGYVSEEEYSQKASDLIGRPADEIAALTRAQRVLSDDMLTLVTELRMQHKTAMLSNVGRGVIDDLFAPGEQKRLFDAVVLSSEVGMVKPHAEIYELAAAKLGLKTDECIMVDDLSVNVEGARTAGMRGITFKDPQQCRADIYKLLEIHA